MKAFIFYPPVGKFQRGEDRCQADTESGSATSLRAPNDLAYIAAVLRTMDITPLIYDYPAENKTWEHFQNDFATFQPHIIIMSTVTGSIHQDIEAFNWVKQKSPKTITIAKGAHFFDSDIQFLNTHEYQTLDYAIYGEADVIIKDLIHAIHNKTSLENIDGIIYRDSTQLVQRTKQASFLQDLDLIPYPARDLIKNELYIRPDTGEAQATIQTSRGCPSKCIFCLSPTISGSKLRTRSVQNVIGEIEECVHRYNIRNFFFRADTFTFNRRWVLEFCEELKKKNLKIQWVANSRVDSIDVERVNAMKEAGCWLIAYGFESGNDETLQKIKKYTTIQQARDAVQITKASKLKVYGFYLIGFPWDTKETVLQTINFAKELDCDFNEIHIATPYEGTELFEIANNLNLLSKAPIGHNYFSNPPVGTQYLSREELMKLRNDGLKALYLKPRYIIRTILSVKTPIEFVNYMKYGFRLLKNLCLSGFKTEKSL